MTQQATDCAHKRSSTFNRSRGEAADNLALEEHDQKEQGSRRGDHGCDGEHDIAFDLGGAQKAGDGGYHGFIFVLNSIEVTVKSL